MKKLKNWWWYHRVHVLIAAAVTAVIVYSFAPGLAAPKPDCGAAVVGRTPLPEETLAALRSRLEEKLGDLNGDGRAFVEVSSYTLDLSGQTEGYLNYQGAAAFDADLVGERSCLFLCDDAAGFRANVAVPTEEIVPCAQLPLFSGLLPEGYGFTARSDGNGPALYRMILQP